MIGNLQPVHWLNKSSMVDTGSRNTMLNLQDLARFLIDTYLQDRDALSYKMQELDEYVTTLLH